jgi:hypothetical protein
MIAVEQNSPPQLRRLAAQRQLYATAKAIFIAQIVLSGPVAVVSAFIARAIPSTEASIALWGFIVLLCDVFWLAPWLDRRRTEAAQVQEAFDCDVLGLHWNEIKVGKRPDPEVVKEQADRYARWAMQMPPLENWYSPTADSVPLHIGRVACQRSNCSWDSRLRRRYASLVVVGCVILGVTILVLSFEHNYTLKDFVLKVVAPSAPAIGLCYRQFTEQREAAARLDDLKDHCDGLWEAGLSGIDEEELTRRSRYLQDEIFESRRRSPLVFDKVFKWLRPSFEAQMTYAVDDLVADAKRRLPATQE